MNIFKGFKGFIIDLVLTIFAFGMIFFIKEKYFQKKPSIVPKQEQLKTIFLAIHPLHRGCIIGLTNQKRIVSEKLK
jgi:hypothetical protein